MKKINKVEKYSIRKDYFYFVEESADMFSAWIGKEDYGLMLFVVGEPKKLTSKDEFLGFLEEDAESNLVLFCAEFNEVLGENEEAKVLAEYKAECSEIASQLSAEGKPAWGADYELRVEDLRKWYKEQYPNIF